MVDGTSPLLSLSLLLIAQISVEKTQVRHVRGGAGVSEVRAGVGAGFEEVRVGAEEEIDALVEEGAGGDAVHGDVEGLEGLGG